jgi:hypothetical protein
MNLVPKRQEDMRTGTQDIGLETGPTIERNETTGDGAFAAPDFFDYAKFVATNVNIGTTVTQENIQRDNYQQTFADLNRP